MSYKRYIKRGGKVYGPYIYSSKRVGGKVVSEYLGQKPRGSGKKLFLSVFLIAFLLASIFLGVQYFNSESSFSSESISPEVFDGTSDLVKFDEAKEEPKVLDVLRQVVNSVSNSFMSLVGYVTEGSEDLDSEDKEEKVRKNKISGNAVKDNSNKGVSKKKEEPVVEEEEEEPIEIIVEVSLGEEEEENPASGNNNAGGNSNNSNSGSGNNNAGGNSNNSNSGSGNNNAGGNSNEDSNDDSNEDSNNGNENSGYSRSSNLSDSSKQIKEKKPKRYSDPEEFLVKNETEEIITLNETEEIITLNETEEILVNANTTLVHEQIVINQPVKWTKTLELNTDKEIKTKVPKRASKIQITKLDKKSKKAKNISVQKVEKSSKGNSQKEFVTSENISSEGRVEIKNEGTQGEVIVEEEINEEKEKKKNKESKIKSNVNFKLTGNLVQDSERGFLINLFKKIMGAITGRVVLIEEYEEFKEILINDSASDYEIVYETPAPVAVETKTKQGKKLAVSADDDWGYTNILAYVSVDERLNILMNDSSKVKIYWQENSSYMDFDAFDLDSDGILDYLEWIVPHLSNQTFEIILITKAEHLDSNRTFIEDVYLNVSSRDGIFSSIPASHYLRVSFEQNLTPTKDITIYARSSENASVEVYEKDGTELIAGFGIISEDKKYQIYLTNLTGEPQDTFDLKIVGGNVDFDFVVDPVSGCDPDASTCGDTACNAFFITNRTSWAYSSDTCTVSYGGEPPQWNYILEDAACDGASVTGGNSGQCAKYNDGCGDIVYCPSYDRKGSAVTAGDCSGCDEGCGFSIDCEDLGAWFDFTSEFFLGDSTVYPLFSNYADNNGSLAGNGTAIFNVTVENTNGTVWLEINNTNYTANNLSINVWNYSFYLVNGTYNYTWWAYGNGTGEDLNSSSLQNYFIFNVNTISDVNTSLDIVLADNESVNPETDELNGTHVVLLNSNSSALKIAELNVDFSQGINWSDITADANSTLAKSFVHLPSGHSEISGNISLYVPVKDNTGSVYICPNATSLNDVNTSCPNRYFSFVTNVSEYYKLNVSGTGAAETPTSKLVIYDSNDTEGGSNVIQVNEQAYFYANYSDNVTGIPIVGATCNFSENSTGSFSTQVGTSYNATSLLYEYNKTFASNLTIDWSVNCYGNASYSNLTVNDTIIIANGSSLTPPAVIESYEPYTAGIGTNFNITATVTDADGIDSVLLEYSGVNYTMSNISSKYYYNFSFWTNGTRTFRIFANDTNGYSNSSENISINIYANNLTLQLKTAGANISQVKDNFTVGEIINLTDPPSFQFDFGFVEEEKLILWDKIKDLFL